MPSLGINLIKIEQIFRQKKASEKCKRNKNVFCLERTIKKTGKTPISL